MMGMVEMSEKAIVDRFEHLISQAKSDGKFVCEWTYREDLEFVLALINHYKAELDRLTSIEEAHREQNGELRKEVERLEQNIKEAHIDIKEHLAEIEKLCGEVDELIIAKDQLFDEAEALIKTARAEAIKEVVERLHIAFRHYEAKDELSKKIFLHIVELSAKEMGVEL